MGAAQEEADALLIQLAQRAGGIEPLLHGVFSFLKRKTDFYHIQREGDRIGFPPGKAKRLVMEAYERFESDAAAPPPPKGDLEQRGERLLPDGRRPSPAAGSPACYSLASRPRPKGGAGGRRGGNAPRHITHAHCGMISCVVSQVRKEKSMFSAASAVV
jgi:hypothetical protein